MTMIVIGFSNLWGDTFNSTHLIHTNSNLCNLIFKTTWEQSQPNPLFYLAKKDLKNSSF